MPAILAATTLILAQLTGSLIGLAIFFFIIAIVAYALGAGGVAGLSASIGRMLLVVFIILAIISLIIALVR